jgi:hypothetical protein
VLSDFAMFGEDGGLELKSRDESQDSGQEGRLNVVDGEIQFSPDHSLYRHKKSGLLHLKYRGENVIGSPHTGFQQVVQLDSWSLGSYDEYIRDMCSR